MIYLDGTPIDWSSVKVMVDGNLASAVYEDGVKVWPYVAPPRPQALYGADPSLLVGGTVSDVVMYPIDGPYDGPGLGLSVTFPGFVRTGPSGTLYVADSASAVGGVDTLWRYDGTAQASVSFPAPLGQFAVDSQGAIYMLGGGSTLHRIKSGQFELIPLTDVSSLGGIAIGPDDALYVLDISGPGTGSIYRYDNVLIPAATPPFGAISAFTVDASGLMYTTDQRSTVYRFDGINDPEAISFTDASGITSIAVDADGVIYVAASGSAYRHDGVSQTTVVDAATSGRYIYSIAVGPSLG